MRTITGEMTAWISEYSASNKAFDKLAVSSYSIIEQSYDMAIEGWTRAGTARLSIDLVDDDEITTNMVAALKAQKQVILAKSQMEVNRIDERIQSLLALPNHSEVEA